MTMSDSNETIALPIAANGQVGYRLIVSALLIGAIYSLYQAVYAETHSPQADGIPLLATTVLPFELGLTVDEASLNLGRIPTHAHASRSIVFSNPSTHEVHVDSIVASCGCTRVDPIDFTIAPGSSQQVTVNVTAHQYSGAGTRAFDATLSLRSGTLESQFLLTATAYDPIQPASATIVFPEPIRHGEAAVSSPATLFVAPEVTDVELSLPKDVGSIVDQQEIVANGQRQVIFRVAVLPVKVVAQLTVPVIVRTVIPNVDTATVRWPCVGVVKSDIHFMPSSLIIAGSAGDESASPAELKIWSESGLPIEQLTIAATALSLTSTVSYSETKHRSVGEFRHSGSASPTNEFGTVIVRGISPVNHKEFILTIPTTIYIGSHRPSSDESREFSAGEKSTDSTANPDSHPNQVR